MKFPSKPRYKGCIGDADGSVSGAVHTTRDVVRSALQIIGKNQKYSLVSSLFLMLMPRHMNTIERNLVFTDCGFVIEMSSAEFCEIAAAAADNAKTLLDIDPKVAFLSFATHESAEHHLVDKVKLAAESLKKTRPDLIVDGPVQLDTAISPDIAHRKTPGTALAGCANILVFPDLNSGNIGYKIAEQLGQAKAIGPVLQGLAKPVNDLSRGCDADAVYNMIALTVLQAQTLDHA